MSENEGTEDKLKQSQNVLLWITKQMTSRLAELGWWKQQAWHLSTKKDKNSQKMKGEKQGHLVEIS